MLRSMRHQCRRPAHFWWCATSSARCRKPSRSVAQPAWSRSMPTTAILAAARSATRRPAPTCCAVPAAARRVRRSAMLPYSREICENHMTVELEEFAPNRWRVAKATIPPKRSALAFPMIISDEMDATEQVDGKFYTSKSEIRKVGKSLGLVEIGNEKIKPRKWREINKRENEKARRESLEKAVARYAAGERSRRYRGAQ